MIKFEYLKLEKTSLYKKTYNVLNFNCQPLYIEKYLTSSKNYILTLAKFIDFKINNDKKLFMVENIGNPMDEVIGGELDSKIEINLGKFAKNTKFYSHGKLVERKPINGVIIEKMHCGEALFIEV